MQTVRIMDNLHKIDKPVCVISIWLAFSVVIASILTNLNGESIATVVNAGGALSLVLATIPLSILFYITFISLFTVLENSNDVCVELSGAKLSRIMGLILTLWLPWIIGLLPGYYSNDLASEVLDGLDLQVLSAHHPILITLIMTILFKVGYLFAGVNGGVFMTSTFQILTLAFSLLMIIYTMVLFKAPKKILRYSILFYGLLPILPLYGLWGVKDTVSTVLFCITFCQMLIIVHQSANGLPRPARLLPTLLCGVLCVLSRNDAVYVLLPLFIVVVAILLKRRSRRVVQIAIQLFAVLLIPQMMLSLLGSAVRIVPGNSREMLSLPMQQVARTIKYHPGDLTAEEQSTFERAATVPLEEVAASYTPYISDPVKARFDLDAGKCSIREFLSAWVSLGIRHPGSYLTSFLNGTRGYWSVFEERAVAVQEALPVNYLQHATVSPLPLNNSVASDCGHAVFPNCVNAAKSFVSNVFHTPILRVLLSPALYIWLTIILAIQIKRVRGIDIMLVALTPLLMKVAICFASPLAGSVRYALPIIVLVPLLFVLASGESARPKMIRNAMSRSCQLID